MFSNPDDAQIKELLEESRTIAVVGLSAKPHRDSFKVAKYMQERGYRIIPVNPALKEEVLGEKPYSSLSEVPEQVDIVNVFRRSEDVPAVVQGALPLAPKAIWMQLGIVNEGAAEAAEKDGITVVMDRCIKIDHGLLMGEHCLGSK